MRYLFFDIECCDGRNICEFGYVVTNENFEVLAKNNIIINPNAKFNLVGRPNQKDLILFYPESEYYKSAYFPKYYEDIHSLLAFQNQIIVGHAIANDAGFIRNATNRYNCMCIDYRFYDSQKMFQEYFNTKKSVSLENAGYLLEIEKPKYIHKSDGDAFSTMKLVAAMCKAMEVSLPDLIDLCPTCGGQIKNNEIKFDDREISIGRLIDLAQKDTSNMIRGKNYRLFLKFLDAVHTQGERICSELTDKTLSISINYELPHFKEMLALVQLLKNHGCTYKLKASTCDYFVKYDEFDDAGDIRYCSRLKYVKDAINCGKNIKIISFGELIKILGVIDKDLSNYPFPNRDDFVLLAKQTKKQRGFVSKSKPTTLGDLLKSQGVDLSKFTDSDK